jgi:site-specific DNA recombinase
MIRAAIYCRVSTDNQETEGTSLQSQLQGCLDYCKVKGYEVVTQSSESYSGLSLERPKLDTLREMVRNDEIDSIVIHSLDRLSRDPVHGVIIIEELEKYHVKLEAVTETMDSSEVGKLISYIHGFASKLEASKIKERTMRGKRTLALQGVLANGGGRLFGYDYTPRVKRSHDNPGTPAKRTINEVEATIVRRVFTSVAEKGYGLYRTVKDLNDDLIPSPSGGNKWNENTVWRILHNPAYKGEYYAFRYKCVPPKNPKIISGIKNRTHILRDKSEWIPLPNVNPIIIETELWDAAQAQLEINRRAAPRKRTHNYLLTGGGHLRCGTCGRAMSSSLKKTPNKDYRRYRCVSTMKSNYYQSCGQKLVSADWLESVVWERIAKILKNPKVALSQLDKERSKSTISLDADIVLKNKNLDDLQDERKRYLHQYGKGLLSENDFETESIRIKRVTDRVLENINTLEAARQSILTAAVSYDQLSGAVEVLADQVRDADFETKKLALRWLSIVVTVKPDGSVLIDGSLPPSVKSGAINNTML